VVVVVDVCGTVVVVVCGAVVVVGCGAVGVVVCGTVVVVDVCGVVVVVVCGTVVVVCGTVVVPPPPSKQLSSHRASRTSSPVKISFMISSKLSRSIRSPGMLPFTNVSPQSIFSQLIVI
jgi:hypothetical protein